MSRSRHVRPSSAAVPRHRRSRDLPQLIRRGTIGAGIVAVAALIGLGGTSALWSSTTSIAPPAVRSGSIDIAQTALADATVQYSGTVLQKTTSLTLTNTGTSSAEVTSAVSTSGDTGLIGAVVVNIWKVESAATCTETVGTSGEAGNWSALRNLPTSIAAGETQTYCVRTTLTAAQASAAAGKAYDATLTFTAKRGGWSSTATARVSQSAASAGAITGTGSCTQGWYAELRWEQPASITGYVLYELVLAKEGTSGTVVDKGNLNSGSRYVSLDSSYLTSVATGTAQTLFVRVKNGDSAAVATWTIQYGFDGRTRCAQLPTYTCTQTSDTRITLTWATNGAYNWRAATTKGNLAQGGGVDRFSISAADLINKGYAASTRYYTELINDSSSIYRGAFTTDKYWRPVCA